MRKVSHSLGGLAMKYKERAGEARALFVLITRNLLIV